MDSWCMSDPGVRGGTRSGGWCLWWVPKRATQSPDSAQKAAARAGISWRKPESGFPITMIWPADANTSMVGRENVRSSAMSLL